MALDVRQRPALGDYYTNAMFPGALIDGSDSYRDPRSPAQIAASMGKVHILKPRAVLRRGGHAPGTKPPEEAFVVYNPFEPVGSGIFEMPPGPVRVRKKGAKAVGDKRPKAPRKATKAKKKRSQ